MPLTLKWGYYVGFCWFELTGPILSLSGEGVWRMDLDKQFTLHEGLNYMGEKGYELVGIQLVQESYRGSKPCYFYIFKKPLPEKG